MKHCKHARVIFIFSICTMPEFAAGALSVTFAEDGSDVVVTMPGSIDTGLLPAPTGSGTVGGPAIVFDFSMSFISYRAAVILLLGTFRRSRTPSIPTAA